MAQISVRAWGLVFLGVAALSGCTRLVTVDEMAGEWCVSTEDGVVDRWIMRDDWSFERYSDEGGATWVDQGSYRIERRFRDSWLIDDTPDREPQFEWEIVVTGCQFMALRLEQDPEDENHVDRSYGRMQWFDGRTTCFGSGRPGRKLKCRYLYGGVTDPPGCFDEAAEPVDLTDTDDCSAWFK